MQPVLAQRGQVACTRDLDPGYRPTHLPNSSRLEGQEVWDSAATAAHGADRAPACRTQTCINDPKMRDLSMSRYPPLMSQCAYLHETDSVAEGAPKQHYLTLAS